MLSGQTPFQGNNPKEIEKQIMEGNVRFNSQAWTNLSKDAKDLVSALLTKSEKDRIGPVDAIEHTWIKRAAPQSKDRGMDAALISNLSGFCQQNQLKKTALHVIARRLEEDEIKGLKDTFVALDKNSDGVVTFTELREGIAKLGMRAIPDNLKELMDQ